MNVCKTKAPKACVGSALTSCPARLKSTSGILRLIGSKDLRGAPLCNALTHFRTHISHVAYNARDLANPEKPQDARQWQRASGEGAQRPSKYLLIPQLVANNLSACQGRNKWHMTEPRVFPEAN